MYRWGPVSPMNQLEGDVKKIQDNNGKVPMIYEAKT